MLKKRTLNEKGALEGLPLYLIILVVVAGVGTAIIVGWMMNAESTELDHIEVDEDDKVLSTNAGQSVTIRAYDGDGNGLEGAVVTLEGCEVQESGQTDGDGVCTIQNVHPSLPQNKAFGDIQVTVKYTGDRTTTRQATITVEA